MILETIPIFQSSCCDNLEIPLLISSPELHASICCQNVCFCLVSQGQRVSKIRLNPGVRGGSWASTVLICFSDTEIQAHKIVNLEISKSSTFASSMHPILHIQVLDFSDSSNFCFLIYNNCKITLAQCNENLEIIEIGSYYSSEPIIGITALSETRMLIFKSNSSIEISTSQFRKTSKWFYNSNAIIVSSDIYDDVGVWVDETGLVSFRHGNVLKTMDSKKVGDYLGVKSTFLVNQVWFFSKNCIVFKFENGMVGLIELDENFSLTNIELSQSFFPLSNIQVLRDDQILVLDVKSKIVRDNTVQSYPLFQEYFLWILRILALIFPIFMEYFKPFSGYKIECLESDDCVMELTTVIKLSPLENLQRRLLFQEYPKALEIALNHSLDTDLVYKTQIKDMISLKHHISFLKIEPILDKVNDRKWLMDFCLLPANSAALTRSLLDYIILQTKDLSQRDIDQEIDAFFEGRKYETSLPISPAAALRFRVESLCRIDKLDLYEALYSGSFQDFSFNSKLNTFYSRSYLDISQELASKGKCSALNLIFSRFYGQASPYRFQILDKIPDDVKISDYEDLIPKIGHDGYEVEILPLSYFRKRDWVERNEIIDFLRLLDEILIAEIQKDNDLPATRNDWLDWFKKRIARMEHISKRNALELANLAIARGFESECTIIRDRLNLLEKISSSDFAEKLSEVDLMALETFPPHDLLRSFMILADLNGIEELFSVIIVPFLAIIEQPFQLLRNVLIEISSKDLSLLAKLSNGQTIQSLKDFASIDDLKLLLMDCALACNLNDSYENLDLILNCLLSSFEIRDENKNDWDIGEEGEHVDPISDVSDDIKKRVNCFAAYVKAKNTFSLYNIEKPLKWFSVDLKTTTRQEQIIGELFQNAVALNSDWAKLLNQLDELNQDGILPHLSRTKMYADALKIILRDGKITLAKKIAFPSSGSPPIPMQDLETIVLDSARDFFDNAESGDKTKGYMKIALNCLSIYPKPTAAIIKERDLIDAVHLITCSHYSLDLLPIQFRLEPDRLSIIKRLVDENPKIIEDLGYVYGLAEKLLGFSLCANEKVKILALVSAAAIPINPNLAFEICQKGSELVLKLQNSDEGVIHELLSTFFLFLNEEAIRNHEQKRQLVVQALLWCPSKDIPNLVDIYQQLELQNLCTKMQGKNDRQSIEERLNFTGSLCDSNLPLPAYIYSEQLNDCFLDLDHCLSDKDAFYLLWQALGLNGGIERVDDILWDETIIELAKFLNFRNPVTSICLLFSLKNSKNSKLFFDQISPSAVNEKLAAYFFSLILRLSSSKHKSQDTRLYQIPFHQITNGRFLENDIGRDSLERKVKDMSHIQNQDKEIKAKVSPLNLDFDPLSVNLDFDRKSMNGMQKREISPINEDDLDGWSDDNLDLDETASRESLHIDSASSLKIMAEQYSIDIREKRRDNEIKNFVSKRKFDPFKFENDESYRCDSFVECSKTIDAMLWSELIFICSYFQYDVAQLLKANIDFCLQGDPAIELMHIYHFYETTNIFETYPDELVGYIISHHILAKSNNLLKLYYKILKRCRIASEKLLGSGSLLSLEDRTDFIESNEKFYQSYYVLNNMISIIHLSNGSILFDLFKQNLLAGKSFDWIQDFLHQAFSLKSIFPEETWNVEDSGAIDEKVSKFLTLIIEDRASKIEPDKRDGRQEYMYLIKDGLRFLRPQDQFHIVTTLIFSAKIARFSPTEKLSFLETIELSQETQKGLEQLWRNMEFSDALQSIRDAELDVDLSPNDIHSLEEAFSTPEEIIKSCMLILNNPPTIITQLFDVLKRFDQFDNRLNNVQDLYSYAINKLLKVKDTNGLDTIETIVRTVMEYVPHEEEDDDNGWGFEEEEMEKWGFSCIEDTIRNILLDSIGCIDNFDLEDISRIKSILNMYFILSEDEIERIKGLESSYVSKMWGLEGIQENNSSKQEFIANLISSTDSNKKLTYLASQMENWIKEDLSEGNSDLWYIVKIYEKAVSIGEFSFLIDLRLKLHAAQETLGNGEEESFLENLKTHSEIEFVKNCLISDNIEIVERGELYLKQLLPQRLSDVKKDYMFHMIICSRISDIYMYSGSHIWGFLEDTLCCLCKSEIGPQHDIFGRVVLNLVKNKNISLAVSLAAKLTNANKEITSGLVGWKFLLDSFIGKSEPLDRKTIYQLSLILKKAITQ